MNQKLDQAYVPGCLACHLSLAEACFALLAETGSSDSQPELSLGEKRSLRIKRREQRQLPTTSNTPGDTCSPEASTAAAFSPVPSQNRTHHAAPARPRTTALPGMSCLADQSAQASDSEVVDGAAGMEGTTAGVQHYYKACQRSPSIVVTEKSVPAGTGQKRKRQQQLREQSTQEAAVAPSIQAADSMDASNHPDPDVMTEQSRSSEAATPVGPTKRRSKLQHKPKPKTAAAQHAQQVEQELESEAAGTVRRTGRQRKLTAAAAAAVEDFPSLYRNSTKPMPPAKKWPSTTHISTSSAASDDWRQQDEPATMVSRQKHAKLPQATSGKGVSQVQMSQLVRSGVLPAGRHEFLFLGKLACEVEVLPDGESQG